MPQQKIQCRPNRSTNPAADRVGVQRIHITLGCHVSVPFVVQDIDEFTRRIKTTVELIPGVVWISPNEVSVRFEQPVFGS